MTARSRGDFPALSPRAIALLALFASVLRPREDATEPLTVIRAPFWRHLTETSHLRDVIGRNAFADALDVLDDAPNFPVSTRGIRGSAVAVTVAPFHTEDDRATWSAAFGAVNVVDVAGALAHLGLTYSEPLPASVVLAPSTAKARRAAAVAEAHEAVADVAEKECRACKTTQPASDFYARESALDGLDTYCKPCRRDQVRTSRGARHLIGKPPMPKARKRNRRQLREAEERAERSRRRWEAEEADRAAERAIRAEESRLRDETRRAEDSLAANLRGKRGPELDEALADNDETLAQLHARLASERALIDERRDALTFARLRRRAA